MISYDPNNIFAKILRGDISCHKILETDYILAFHDVKPKAKIHALVIPKGAYISSYDFHGNASDQELKGYYQGLNAVLSQLGLCHMTNTKGGYRLISNAGINGGQEVPHFHTHILGGEKI